MKFSHPLARSAKVWPAYLTAGSVHKILVVVTTLELDPDDKKFKPDHVERLSAASRTFLADHPGKADGFVLVHKSKD